MGLSVSASRRDIAITVTLAKSSAEAPMLAAVNVPGKQFGREWTHFAGCDLERLQYVRTANFGRYLELNVGLGESLSQLGDLRGVMAAVPRV